MKKKIFLFLSLIMLFSSIGFSNNIPPMPRLLLEEIERQDNNNNIYFISYNPSLDQFSINWRPGTTPFYVGWNDLVYNGSISRKVYSSDNQLISSWGSYSVGRTTQYANDFLKKDRIIYSGQDIYTCPNLEEVFFFGLPPSPFQVGMEGAQQTLLSQILMILPIILGTVVLVVGLRKAYRMLQIILYQA